MVPDPSNFKKHFKNCRENAREAKQGDKILNPFCKNWKEVLHSIFDGKDFVNPVEFNPEIVRGSNEKKVILNLKSACFCRRADLDEENLQQTKRQKVDEGFPIHLQQQTDLDKQIDLEPELNYSEGIGQSRTPSLEKRRQK